MSKLPVKGDVGIYREMRGGRPIQEQPFECRSNLNVVGRAGVCLCPKAEGETGERSRFRGGPCYGWTVPVAVMVADVVHYMDNSIEVHYVTADGRRIRSYAKMPSGDVCY